MVMVRVRVKVRMMSGRVRGRGQHCVANRCLGPGLFGLSENDVVGSRMGFGLCRVGRVRSGV